jgi:hypothetical protein
LDARFGDLNLLRESEKGLCGVSLLEAGIVVKIRADLDNYPSGSALAAFLIRVHI